MADHKIRQSGIYCILHVKSGRTYIGSAVRLDRRWSHHLCLLRQGTHPAKHLQSAWTRYGEDAFHFKVVEVVSDKASLLSREQFWIDRYNGADHEHGFNTASQAGSQLGYRHSIETRLKMSKSHTGRTLSPEHVAACRAAMAGRIFSPEHRAKLSIAQTGKRHSADACARMSASHTGVPLTAETRAKMSAAHKGKSHTAIHTARVWESRRRNLLSRNGPHTSL